MFKKTKQNHTNLSLKPNESLLAVDTKPWHCEIRAHPEEEERGREILHSGLFKEREERRRKRGGGRRCGRERREGEREGERCLLMIMGWTLNFSYCSSQRLLNAKVCYDILKGVLERAYSLFPHWKKIWTWRKESNKFPQYTSAVGKKAANAHCQPQNVETKRFLSSLLLSHLTSRMTLPSRGVQACPQIGLHSSVSYLPHHAGDCDSSSFLNQT